MVHWNLQVSLVSSNFSSSSNPASKLKHQDDGPLELMGDGSPWSPLYRRLPPARLPSEGSHQVWRKRSTTIRNTPGTRMSSTIFTIWIHDDRYPIPIPPNNDVCRRHDRAVDEDGTEYIIVDLWHFWQYPGTFVSNTHWVTSCVRGGSTWLLTLNNIINLFWGSEFQTWDQNMSPCLEF